MRHFIKTIIVTLALTASVTVAQAATYENASRLAAVMGLANEIDRAIGDAVSAVRSQLVQQGAPAQKIDAFIAAFRDELDAGAPQLLTELTHSYADRFSDAEILELIRFYETPAGRKLVDVQHELAVAQTQAVSRWVNAAAQNASNKVSGATNDASV
ncbi:MAG: DUF2059 domain-containing protein [Pseudomonadota bacterium]